MDKEVAVRQLCEFHGIPPYHNSDKKNSPNVAASLTGAFGKPITEIEVETGFTRVKDFYDNQMRRMGKEVTALVKQVTR